MKQPQLEDMIIKETLKAVFNWIVLILFVLALCWIGYLLSANESKAYTINNYELKHYRDSIYIDALLDVDVKQDSIIDTMPPVEYLDFLKRQGK